MTRKYFGGCDVGSTTGKAVILDENGKMVASMIVPSEIDPEVTSVKALEAACAKVDGLQSYKDLAYLVAPATAATRWPLPMKIFLKSAATRWVRFPAPRPSKPL